MMELEILKKITGEDDTELLIMLYESAEETALTYMNRKKLPPALKNTVLRLAAIQYNRLGTEGETSRNEAGITSSFVDLPADIMAILNRYRLARVGGKTFEA